MMNALTPAVEEAAQLIRGAAVVDMAEEDEIIAAGHAGDEPHPDSEHIALKLQEDVGRFGPDYPFKGVATEGPDNNHAPPGGLVAHANPDSWLFAAHYLAVTTCDDPVDWPCKFCVQQAQETVRTYVRERGGYDPQAERPAQAGGASEEFYIP